MKVNVYVSQDGGRNLHYGLVAARQPITLPRGEGWKYLRSADTAELSLPEAIEEEIQRKGFWMHRFGDGNSRERTV